MNLEPGDGDYPDPEYGFPGPVLLRSPLLKTKRSEMKGSEMSENSMVPFGGASLPSTEAFGKALTQHRAPVVAAGGSPYLRLLREGMWVYGPENIEPQEGSVWAINPYSLAEGYVAWGDGEKIGERMSRIFMGQPPVNNADLPPAPGAQNGWEVQVGFDLKCTNGEDEGTEVQYFTNSLGGKRAYGTIVQALQAQYASDPEKLVPLVELEMDSYQHKKYGKIYTPIFKIVGWASMEGPAAEATPVEEKEPAPAQPARDADELAAENYEAMQEEAAEPAPAAQDEPVRRRRRRAAA